MCLGTRQKRAKIAKADMIVYKHLKSIDNNNFLTSYRYSQVKIGQIYKSELDKPDSDGNIEVGLHSFVNVNDAEMTAKYWCETLVKCVIPKGSRYYEGTFMFFHGNEFLSIASDTLQYLEILPIVR